MTEVKNIVLDFFNENATILFFVCDGSGIVKQTNRFTKKVIGDSVIGKELSSIFVDFFNAFKLEDFLRDQKALYLLNVTTKSGLPQTFYFRFFKTEEAIVVIGETDSEEMDNLRRNLITLNSELNNLTRELQKKNAELQRLNELKNHFLGIAAHDLRTPIGAIKNFCEFLLDETRDRLEEEHLQFLVTIKSLSDFMLQLLNDLLDITAIEAGKLKFSPQPVDLKEVIRESLEITGIFAQKKDITVVCELEDGLPLVSADPMRIKQVLDNLLTNAIKFSERGTKVTVTSQRQGQMVVTSVEDEGPGVPEKDIDKLFKAFSKTSVQSTAGEKGAGLGLAIAKKIVESHKGRIWIDTQKTKGAKFSFSLPIAGL